MNLIKVRALIGDEGLIHQFEVLESEAKRYFVADGDLVTQQMAYYLSRITNKEKKKKAKARVKQIDKDQLSLF